ncbi:uncharacterized protein LOC130670469 [Microplitis mediator]|uniref:uncharacterized protein LOC130670469 n=1 Tax=Microplitis mediator TaxID=375433 RepID=UPI00255555CB|nr:uncharacterized protein LOC130670469 [Microplitis mediator]
MKQIKASPEGPIIFEDYEQNRKLNPTSQQSVVDIIGRFLFPWLEKNVMKNCHYRSLLNKIKETFPNECLSVYFIKPVPKRLSPTNKPISMRGKLPDKIRNTRFTSGMSKSKKKRLINVFDLSIEDKRRRYNELSEDHVYDVEWLKENYEPWDTVIEKWRSTHEIRSCCTHKTVAEFFNEWPILNDLRGKDLIFMDFACMYPDKINLLRSSWPTFFDRIKTLRSSKYASDETIQSYKELISTLENEVESINCNDIKRFF